ncbi:MAG: NAD(P)-dependent oxidoreductase [Burkholderiales bacterium]|nr:NAD(P)-dependent oxidoreductase [Burkholderiales bacterium]
MAAGWEKRDLAGIAEVSVARTARVLESARYCGGENVVHVIARSAYGRSLEHARLFEGVTQDNPATMYRIVGFAGEDAALHLSGWESKGSCVARRRGRASVPSQKSLQQCS